MREWGLEYVEFRELSKDELLSDLPERPPIEMFLAANENLAIWAVELERKLIEARREIWRARQTAYANSR